MNIHFSEEAISDAKHAADWYIDQDARPTAAALHVEIGNALARIGAEAGLRTSGPEGTRIFPVHRSPVSLVDRMQGDMVRVITVAAQRRRLGYWHGRR